MEYRPVVTCPVLLQVTASVVNSFLTATLRVNVKCVNIVSICMVGFLDGSLTLLLFMLQWLSPRLMILYRAVMAVYTTSWSVAGGVLRADGGAKWFIFLTNWGYTFLNIHFILGTILPIYHYSKIQRKASSAHVNDYTADHQSNAVSKSAVELHKDPDTHDYKRCPAFRVACKASWVIYNIAACIGPVITAAYWSAVYTPGMPVDGADVDAHAVNSVMIILDTLICSIPIRLLHVVHGMLFVSVYAVFTVVYWQAGGTNTDGKPYVYAVLDYQNHPTLAVIMIVAIFFVALPLSQFFLYCLFRFRCWLSERRAGSAEKNYNPQV